MEYCSCSNDIARHLGDKIRDTIDDEKDNMAPFGCDKFSE
jgi:hypothetical protein